MKFEVGSFEPVSGLPVLRFVGFVFWYRKCVFDVFLDLKIAILLSFDVGFSY